MRRPLFLILFTFLSLISQAQKRKSHVSYKVTGKAIYVKHCMTCHQADGTGVQNMMIPPLIKTDYVLGPKAAIIKILLNGLNGDIKVNGDNYSGEMPSQAVLKNSEIAAVLTYVRRSFGNKASPVTVSEVKSARAANKKAGL